MSPNLQIKALFQRWERLEGEKSAISDDLKELFKEAKGLGYDSKALRAAFNKKVKIDEAKPADAQFDLVVDTYLDAINGVARDARLRTRENIEEFDRETGEFLEDGEAVGIASDLPTNSPETAYFQAKANDEACETGSDQTRAEASADASDGVELVSRVVDGRTSTATSERMDATAGETAPHCEYCDGTGDVHRIDGEWLGYCHCEEGQRLKAAPVSPIAPASQGEAEAPTPKDVSLPAVGVSSEGAATGGDNVDASNSSAHQAGSGLVSTSPTRHPVLAIRPHCQHPGEEVCGGSGRQHCRACAAAMREEEVA